MNRITTVLDTPFAQILRFDHPQGFDHHDEEIETPGSYAISFVEAGAYSLARGRNSWNFQTNDVELTYAGDPVRYCHAAQVPQDICLTVHLTPELVGQTLGALPARGAPLRIPASARTIFERYHLTQSLANGDSVGIDFAIQGLIPALFGLIQEWGGKLHHSSRFPFYLSRIRNAVDLLHAEFARPHSLSDVARRVAISPYHFSRIFTGLVGHPPHQYLNQIRLHHASRRLLEGDTVTNAAFDSGFQNLSHFIRMFRKRFGVSPGNFRRLRSHANQKACPGVTVTFNAK